MTKNNKNFKRQDTQKSPNLDESWRRPRGTHSKQRLGKKGHPPMPGVGHRSPKQGRGKHPSGHEEIHVKNRSELEHALEQDTEDTPVAIRLSSRLSTRKKKTFIDQARDNNVPVLNVPQHLQPRNTTQTQDTDTDISN